MDARTKVLRFLWKNCIYYSPSSPDLLTEADSKGVSNFPTAPEPKRRRSFTPPTVDTGEAKPVEQTPEQPAPKAQEPVEDFTFEQSTPPTPPVVETPVEQPGPQPPPTPQPPPVAPTQPAVKYHPTAKVEKTTNPVGPTSVTPLKRRKTQKIIVFSVMGTVLFGLVANTVVGVVNRPADAETIAAQVSAGIASDGYYTPFDAAGEQFLTAYLQSAIQGEDATRSQVIEEMTAGEGNAWVSAIQSPKKDDPKPFVQEIVHGPVLLNTPELSATDRAAASLTYEAWLTTPTGALEQIQLSVPVRLDDSARGVVMAAPAILPLVQRTLPQVEAATTGVDVSTETRAQAELFLKAWSQASPGEDDNDAALNAVIAPEATFYTREGLSGQVDFLALDSISMFAPANEDGTIQPLATGTMTVSWDSSGEVKKGEYLLVMERVGDKWLVKQIGSY